MNNIPRYTSSFPLQPVFKTNADGCGDHTFTQTGRVGSVCMYQRHNGSKVVGYEVFVVKLVKAGAKLPNEVVVAYDYESYPGKHAFGRNAWSFTGSNHDTRAQEKFDFLLKEHTNTTVPVVYVSSAVTPTAVGNVNCNKSASDGSQIPTGEFTQSMFAVMNSLPPRGVVYNILQSLIEKGLVKLNRRVKMGSGRPTSMYVSV